MISFITISIFFLVCDGLLLTKLHDQIVNVGDLASFTCKSNNTKDFIWFFRHATIYRNPKRVYDSEDGVFEEFARFNVSSVIDLKRTTRSSTLLVGNITADDAGLYYCDSIDGYYDYAYTHVITNPITCNGTCRHDRLYVRCKLNYISRSSLFIQWYSNNKNITTMRDDELRENNYVKYIGYTIIKNQTCQDQMNVNLTIYDPKTGSSLKQQIPVLLSQYK